MTLAVPNIVTRVGFVGTRFSGTDGVSLETKKWAEILGRLGLEVSFIAGECDFDRSNIVQIDEAHFADPRIQDITRRAFAPGARRDPELTADILSIASRLKEQIHQVIERMQLDVLIAENAMTFR